MLQRAATTAGRGRASRIRLPRAQIATPAAPAYVARHPSLRNIFDESVPHRHAMLVPCPNAAQNPAILRLARNAGQRPSYVPNRPSATGRRAGNSTRHPKEDHPESLAGSIAVCYLNLGCRQHKKASARGQLYFARLDQAAVPATMASTRSVTTTRYCRVKHRTQILPDRRGLGEGG